MMRSLYLSALLILSAVPAAHAAPDMMEGMWEITTKMEIPGMPQGMAMPPMTHTQCITKSDMIPRDTEQSRDCTINHEVNGNTVTWTIKCDGEAGDVVGNGKVTYHKDRFDGEMVMTVEEGGETMQITNRMSGRRIGDCKR